MQEYIQQFSSKLVILLQNLPGEEISKALHILQAAYERDGRIYVLGNGGSFALASHWVSDFNKTVFSRHLDKHHRRFQAIRVPSTEEELTSWANDVGFDMIFAGPLQNYLLDSDILIAISSSGNSLNVIKAVELAKSRMIPVIGLSGFDGGKLNELADAKILIATEKNSYEIVESVHGAILHLMTKYFKDYFDYIIERS
ncbi:MAG: SIS domain-containing protein [Nanoarchaeota archaeon]|nr:SIS domain-containing protein [Nanoarchaeota archaeon]